MRSLYFTRSVWLGTKECIWSGRNFPIFYNRYWYINVRLPVTFVTSCLSYRTSGDDSPCPVCQHGALRGPTVRAESPCCRNKFWGYIKTTFIVTQPFVQGIPGLFSGKPTVSKFDWETEVNHSTWGTIRAVPCSLAVIQNELKSNILHSGDIS
jgi:hypothetical protein